MFNAKNFLSAALCGIAFACSTIPVLAAVMEPNIDSQLDPKPDAAFIKAAREGNADKLPGMEVIEVPKPPLQALITIDNGWDPYAMDATGSHPISLRESLGTALDNNLAIRISGAGTQSRKWLFTGALGAFLPDTTSGFQAIKINGRLSLPFPTAAGAASSGAGGQAIKLDSRFYVLSGGFSQNLYSGGSLVFSALEQRHNFSAAKAGTRATTSDTLLQVANQYYNLLLQDALLQIRIRAVQVSEEQVRINTDLDNQGLATDLDVLQARTQLSHDRQNLIDQQAARRNAAITLADTLNLNLGCDLEPADRSLRRIELIDRRAKIGDLLRTAIDNRPELKQYDELRKAAKAAIVVAAAPLQPTVRLTGNTYGLGNKLKDLNFLYTLGLAVNWNVGHLGVTDYSNIQSSRWLARQASLQQNQVLLQVLDQVRKALVNTVTADRRVDETANEVASSTEELRLAKLRFANGLGTSLDTITAQRDLTTALIDRAQAIIQYNITQAQLVHDIGTINVDSLTRPSLPRIGMRTNYSSN